MNTLHVPTPLVEFFGNSVIFGDNLAIFPTIFQPFLFYPDWYFVSWPFQLIAINFFAAPNPYAYGFGHVAIGLSIVFWLIGAVLAYFNASQTWTDMSHVNRFPISQTKIDQMQAKGLLAQIAVLPLVIINGVYWLLVKLICVSLFWHIVIARVTTLFITVGGRIGFQLTQLVQAILIAVMIVPPLVYMAWNVITLLARIILQG